MAKGRSSSVSSQNRKTGRMRTGRSGDHHNCSLEVNGVIRAILLWPQVQNAFPGRFRRNFRGSGGLEVRFQRMDTRMANRLKCVIRCSNGLQELIIIACPSSDDGNVQTIRQQLNATVW